MTSAVNRRLHRVVVTGMGMITPVGNTAAASWRGVLGDDEDATRSDGDGSGGVASLDGVDGFEWSESLPSRVAGRVRVNESLAAVEGFGLSGASAPRFVRLAATAADEALRDARWVARGDVRREERTGVSLGNSIGSIDEVFRAGEAAATGAGAASLRKRLSPFFVPRVLVNMAAGAVSIRHALRGPGAASGAACAAGAHAILEAARVLQCGDADVMLAGGSESCINLVTMAGFCRARALSTAFNDEPRRASRPFDVRRDGFVMAEGAAMLVLETEDHALARGARIYCELAGGAISNDAHHVTHPDAAGRGAALAMRRALEAASISPRGIGYVNAHATSTPAGDKAELRAISDVFGDMAGCEHEDAGRERTDAVAVSSTKGATGHLLAAAGAAEAAFAVLAVHHARIPPTFNLDEPINVPSSSGASAAVRLVAHTKGGEEWAARPGAPDGELRAALSNSFGFGGTNASIVFREHRR